MLPVSLYTQTAAHCPFSEIPVLQTDLLIYPVVSGIRPLLVPNLWLKNCTSVMSAALRKVRSERSMESFDAADCPEI